MMYEMRRRKPGPTLIPTQEIFNLPHHTGMVRAELAFDDTVSYIHSGKWIAAGLNIIVMTRIHTPVPRITYRML